VAFSVEHRSQERAGLWGQNNKSSIANGNTAALPPLGIPSPTAVSPEEDNDVSTYRQLLIKEPLLDPHMLRRLRLIFSFQGTELLTHKVTISCSIAMKIYISTRERKQKTRKARIALKTVCCLVAMKTA
jgi:hypothetical protein